MKQSVWSCRGVSYKVNVPGAWKINQLYFPYMFYLSCSVGLSTKCFPYLIYSLRNLLWSYMLYVFQRESLLFELLWGLCFLYTFSLWSKNLPHWFFSSPAMWKITICLAFQAEITALFITIVVNLVERLSLIWYTCNGKFLCVSRNWKEWDVLETGLQFTTQVHFYVFEDEP